MKSVFLVAGGLFGIEVRDRLRHLGYDICGHAQDGESALASIPGLAPDVVLVDRDLDGGLSGLDVAKAIDQLADVPLAFLTRRIATDAPERECPLARGGVVGYVVNPYDLGSLEESIELTLLRYHAAVSLRDSETPFLSLFEQAAMGVAEIDSGSGRFLQVNSQYCNTLGYSREEMRAGDFLACSHPDDLSLILPPLQRLMQGEVREFSMEVRLLHKDGSVVWVTTVVFPLWGAGQPPTTYVAVIKDVSQRKLAEARLLHAQQQLQEAQRLGGIGTWEWDLAANTIRVSRTACALFGLPLEEFEFATYEVLLNLVHPEDRARVVKVSERARATHESFQVHYRIINPGGHHYHVELRGSVVLDERGEPRYVQGCAQDMTWRALDVQALAISEQRYRSLFEDSTECLFLTDPDGVIVRVNPAFARLLGYGSPQELVGIDIAQLFVGQQSRGLGGDNPQAEGVVEAVWRKKNGERLDVQVVKGVLGGEGFHGTVRDVTAKRQYDEALRALSTGLARQNGEAFFHEVVSQLATILDAEVSFVGAVVSGPRPRLRTLALVVDGRPRPQVEYDVADTPCEHVLAGRAVIFPSEVQSRFPLDLELSALRAVGYGAVPLLDAAGRVTGHVGIMTRSPILYPDRVKSVLKLFSLRLAAELERQRAEARFVDVFEFAPDAHIIVDEEGRIVHANLLAQKTFGYTREEFLRLGVEDLMPVSHRADHAEMRKGFLQEARPLRKGSVRTPLRAVLKDGSTRPFEISLSPLRSDSGQLTVAALRDVSERLQSDEDRARLEDQLRHKKKMESLGTLAGGIAHDFNNLLAVISANVELASADVEPGGAVAECLSEIGTASARAGQLVKQILAFSRQQPIRRLVSSLRPVVLEVAGLLRAALPSGIEIVTNIADDAPSVLVDATQIHQVLMNLGTNAAHSIERPSGRICLTLDAFLVSAESPVADGLSPGWHARVRVIDDGKGMDAATLERIFEPFFTTRPVGSGTGLGLAVVHGIVADHGGGIAAESFPGRGTTFSIYLPVATGSVSTPPEAPQPLLRGAGRVILVDDEEAVVRIAEKLIKRLGYQVWAFANASEALSAVKADPGGFDAVITDQNMPEMSGFDLARAITAIRPDLPVVLSSGSRHVNDDELTRAGICFTLDKPYSGASLSQVLEKAIKRASP